MRFAARQFVLPAMLSTCLTAAAGAQQMQCDVNEGSPSQLSRAFLAVSVAQQAQAESDFTKAGSQLQSAAKQISENLSKLNGNADGRNMVLGKTIALSLNQPGIGFNSTRGAIGLVGNPDEPVDLIAMADSLFDEVEKTNPGCVSALAPWRAQKSWITLVNGAIEQFNQDKLDSAVVLATRANRLYDAAPYAYMVLGNVAQRRGQVAAASEAFQKSIATTEGDSNFVDARRSILMALGNMTMEAADTASDAATKAGLQRTAIQAFEQLVKEFPTSPQGASARMGLSSIRLAQGDTASLRAAYQDQMQNPGNYTYQELLLAAVGAARAQQNADAARLFELTLENNPWNRDALFNLAAMYANLQQHQKMIPVIARLVAVDPSNAENWQLYSLAYNGISRAAKAAPAKRAANDSTVKYYEVSEKLPAHVVFTEWTNAPERTSVAGTIENRTEAARTFTITFEFLDKAGNVVATETATTEAVAPKARGRFSLSTTAAGVVAFRYKPIQ